MNENAGARVGSHAENARQGAWKNALEEKWLDKPSEKSLGWRCYAIPSLRLFYMQKAAKFDGTKNER